MIKKQLLCAFLGAVAAANVQAAVVSWTDWSSFTVGTPGTAAGTMAGVSVTYSGQVLSNTQVNGSGANIDYWSPTAPYVGPAISNAPPNREIIILEGQTPPNNLVTNTISFGAPVLNPYMAIVSQGQNGVPVTYNFNQAFTIIDVDRGYWGGDANAWNASVGSQLIGSEAHGVIQFMGLISSISFTASPLEFWHGFTVGVAEIPEPSTWALMLAGLALLGTMTARRTRR